jgi:hypothetical protein
VQTRFQLGYAMSAEPRPEPLPPAEDFEDDEDG